MSPSCDDIYYITHRASCQTKMEKKSSQIVQFFSQNVLTFAQCGGKIIAPRTERRSEMAYDYARLRGRITEICGSVTEFARQMPLSRRAITAKLACKTEWTQTEIGRACQILGINAKDIPAYFFAVDGEKFYQNEKKFLHN